MEVCRPSAFFLAWLFEVTRKFNIKKSVKHLVVSEKSRTFASDKDKDNN